MNRLKRELGVAHGSGLLATSLLGTGIFVVPILAAQAAGDVSLLAWLVLIVLVCPIAWSFALLGRQYPHAGGAAHIVGSAFGAGWGKLTGFMFLAVLPVGLPAALMMALGFWHAVFDINLWQGALIQVLSLVLMLGLGLGGAKLSGNVQVVIALLIVLMVASIFVVSPSLLELPEIEFKPTSLGVGASALGLMFWCFVGIEAFIHMGEEFKNPRRDFPIALVIGVTIAGLVYMLCSLAVVNSAVYKNVEFSSAAIPILMGQLFGPTGTIVASIVGFLACFASINIYLQGFSRLLWSLAEEGQIGERAKSHLGQLNAKKVPSTALIWVTLICILSLGLSLLFELDLDSLIRYANGNFIVVYLLCMLAGIRLLKSFGKVWSGISSLLCLIVLFSLGKDAVYASAILLFYGLYRIWKNRANQEISGTENSVP